MLRLWRTAPHPGSRETREEIFIQRYERLYAWALQLTGNDRQRAEDLVHDAFIQFGLSLTDLGEIQHIDAYLYGILRNIYLAQTRRAIRIQGRSIPIVEYDSAEIGLRVIDPRNQIRLQDELRQICHYACVRKDTSKAGSVLVLRFFHGYYPGEIAQVLRTTRHAVEDWLRIARREARLHLNDPGRLKFMKGTPAADIPQTGFARGIEEFLGELRDNIFKSRRGACPAGDALTDLYRAADSPAVDSTTLGHIVSCPHCIDAVNRLLDLAPLSERYPTDTLGPDTRAKKGGKGGPPFDGGGGPPGVREAVRRYRRGVRRVFEHKPKELCVSVNGYLLGSQRIGSGLNELSLSVKGEEKIEFVEIVSEQEIRLLLLNVNEPPPSGQYEQSERVALSDGRMLEASLSFSNPWPTLHVVYRDPTWEAETSIPSATLGDAANTRAEDPREGQSDVTGDRPPRRLARRLWGGITDWRFWLKPGSVTAVFAALFVAAALLTQVRTPPPTVSAAELLQRSTAAEEATLGERDRPLHRTIAFEERKGEAGELVARGRIEFWHSAVKGITARRLYDEQNRLVAGEWARADGSRVLYRHGTRPRLSSGRRSLDDLWRLALSAGDFAELIGRAEQAQAGVSATAYFINYQGTPVGNERGLIKATLVLNKADLRAVEQTLTVRQDGELREYRFIETGFEKPDQVPPDVFEPEPDLLGPPDNRAESESEPPRPGVEALPPGDARPPATAVAASPELEVEVTYLLDQIKANLGEQVSVRRTQAGTLLVEAIAETEQRKAEIRRALSPVASNPSVEIRLETVAEASRRQAQSSSSEITVREIEVAKNPFPAYPELTRYFSDVRGLSAEQSDAEARRFAGRMLSKSRQAMAHAWALKQLARRFNAEELGRLDPDARAKWFSMIHAHARAFGQEVAGLRQELELIFQRPAPAAEGAETGGATDLNRAADRLFELGSTQEQAIRSAFTTSTAGATSPVIKGRQFWQAVRGAERLAAEIQGVRPK